MRTALKLARNLLGIALCVLLPISASNADDVKSIALPARALIWDSISRRIYATVPGSAQAAGTRANTVTIIQPETGQIVASVPIGAEPGGMALSGSRRTLWVALDGANAVRAFDIAKQAAGTFVSLGPSITAAGIAAAPGAPDAVAVQRQNRTYSPSDNGTVIIDADGTQRKSSVGAGHSLLYDALTDRLYGYENEISSFGLRTMYADAGGLHEAAYAEGLVYGNAHLVSAVNGLLLSDTGNLVDPLSRIKLGQYPGCGYGSVVVGDGSTARVFLAAGERGTVKITAFDMFTFAPLGTITVPSTGGPSALIRWGDDGLAFVDSGGRVVLVRTPLVGPPRKPVDLAVTSTGLPSITSASGKATCAVTVRNLGAGPASGVVVTDQLSPNVDIVNIAGSAGTPVAANGVARLELPALAPGAAATLTVQIQLKPQDTSQEHPLTAVTQSLFVRSGNPDPVPANNHLTQVATLGAAGGAPAAAPASGPDLTGVWTALSQTSEGAGADLQATVLGEFTVKNVGTEAAPPSRLRFFLSGDRIYDPVFAQLLQETGVPELKPGGSFKVMLKARLRKGDDVIGLYVIAIVNATKTAVESNLNNNTLPRGPIP